MSSFILKRECAFCKAMGRKVEKVPFVQNKDRDLTCLRCGSNLGKNDPDQVEIPDLMAEAARALVSYGSFKYRGMDRDCPHLSVPGSVSMTFAEDNLQTMMLAHLTCHSIERSKLRAAEGTKFGPQHATSTMPREVLQALRALGELHFRITEMPKNNRLRERWARLEFVVGRDDEPLTMVMGPDTGPKPTVIRIELRWYETCTQG